MVRYSLFLLMIISTCYPTDFDYLNRSFNESIEGVVKKVIINSTNKNNEDQLCITYIKTKNSKSIGIVEDVYDCYWAQLFKTKIGDDAFINSQYLYYIHDQKLLNFLKTFDSKSFYLLSETE